MAETTGIELGYVEQLYTFGDAGRAGKATARTLAIAYLGLVSEGPVTGSAAWCDLYEFLPWEDRRNTAVEPWISALAPWLASGDAARRARRERITLLFGGGEAGWDVERCLERYELLFEAGAVPEGGGARIDGSPMGLDHRRVLAQALGRIRGKLRYRPVVFELVPPEFTLGVLQRVVEALAGVRLHTGNFRRLLDRSGVVEGIGRFDTATGGRPAELFRFRREVVLERPAPGVGLPGCVPRVRASLRSPVPVPVAVASCQQERRLPVIANCQLRRAERNCDSCATQQSIIETRARYILILSRKEPSDHPAHPAGVVDQGGSSPGGQSLYPAQRRCA